MSENTWREDVISLTDGHICEYRTFTGAELVTLLTEVDQWHEKLVNAGMECRYLSSSGPPGWRKGKVRVAIEFIPDEPPSPPAPSLPPSSGTVESVDGTFFGSYSP